MAIMQTTPHAGLHDRTWLTLTGEDVQQIDRTDVVGQKGSDQRSAVSRCRDESVAQGRESIDTMARFYGQAQFDLLYYQALQEQDDE